MVEVGEKCTCPIISSVHMLASKELLKRALRIFWRPLDW